jgi:hypothetical protein
MRATDPVISLLFSAHAPKIPFCISCVRNLPASLETVESRVPPGPGPRVQCDSTQATKQAKNCWTDASQGKVKQANAPQEAPKISRCRLRCPSDAPATRFTIRSKTHPHMQTAPTTVACAWVYHVKCQGSSSFVQLKHGHGQPGSKNPDLRFKMLAR